MIEIEGYYRPFRTWLENEPQARHFDRDGATYLAAPVAAMDAVGGLAVTAIGAKGPTPEMPARRPSESATHYSGHDGIFVELGAMWSPENMSRQPQERTRSLTA